MKGRAGSLFLLACALSAATALMAGDTSAAQTAPSPPWFPSQGVYLGAAVSTQTDGSIPQCRDPNPETGWFDFQGPACVAHSVYIDRQFHFWDDVWPTSKGYDAWSLANGHRLFISWKPKRTDGSIVTWKSIASGAQDPTLDALAARVKDFAAPMYLTFHHEPDESHQAEYGSPADFRAAWRHVVLRFRHDGVTNVKWILVLMGSSFQSSTGPRANSFWPGADVVDAVGADSYNWFTCIDWSKTWKTFGSIFQPAYSWIASKGKPMVVPEFGSVEDPSQPDRKAAWFADAGSWLKTHPNVKLVSYFQAQDSDTPDRNCDWTVDSSSSSLNAFRSLAADPYFNP